MQNPIQYTYAGIITQVTQAIVGVEAYEGPLALSLVDGATMSATVAAMQAGELSTIQAKAELINRQLAYNTLTGTVRKHITAARDILKPYLGTQYSSVWGEAGFVQSLTIPRKAEKMLPILQALAAYFTAHPTHENVPLNVTAARSTQHYNNLVAGLGGVNSQITTWKLAIATRETKAEQVRGELRALLKELSIRMDPMDERWTAFGFNKPGQLQTPPAPTKVSVTLVGPNAASVKWKKAARAQYYRIWKKVVGMDEGYLPVGSPADLDFTLENLPTGAQIEIVITAVNNGGESAFSGVFVLQMA